MNILWFIGTLMFLKDFKYKQLGGLLCVYVWINTDGGRPRHHPRPEFNWMLAEPCFRLVIDTNLCFFFVRVLLHEVVT